MITIVLLKFIQVLKLGKIKDYKNRDCFRSLTFYKNKKEAITHKSSSILL